jgi:hypothetical protein
LTSLYNLGQILQIAFHKGEFLPLACTWGILWSLEQIYLPLKTLAQRLIQSWIIPHPSFNIGSLVHTIYTAKSQSTLQLGLAYIRSSNW